MKSQFLLAEFEIKFHLFFFKSPNEILKPHKHTRNALPCFYVPYIINRCCK